MNDEVVWTYGDILEDKYSRKKMSSKKFNRLVGKLNEWVKEYNRKMGYA